MPTETTSQVCHQCRKLFHAREDAYIGNWFWCDPCRLELGQAAVGIPSRFRGARLGDWLGLLTDESMNAVKSYRSLFICGGPGRGKTHLSYSIINEHLAQFSGGIVFLEWESLLHSINERGKSRERLVEDLIETAIKAWLLVIDDVGGIREDYRANSFELRTLWLILNGRYVERRYTIVTSNKDLGALGKTFDERIFSRLAEMCFPIRLTGDDRRVPK